MWKGERGWGWAGYCHMMGKGGGVGVEKGRGWLILLQFGNYISFVFYMG